MACSIPLMSAWKIPIPTSNQLAAARQTPWLRGTERYPGTHSRRYDGPGSVMRIT